MLKTLMAVMMLTLTLPFAARAEDRVVELWTCTLLDGKTLDDAKAVNGKWLKLQNSANPGAGIRSWGLTSIVGQPGSFMYLDSFPSLEAWSKSRAAIATPAGVAVDAELNATAECASNSLHEAIEHGTE
ncbi:MAG: hypothetical protein RIC56_13825 [Pseudomonadales bacterium]